MISLEISKVIAAPRAHVFAAWIDPDLVKLWFAPGEMVVAAADVEAKVGGNYRIVMKGQNRDTTPTAVGTYQEIIPNERLVFTWRWDGDPSQPTLVTVTFHDVSGGTRVDLKHERFTSEETCKSHERGWIGCLDNLAKKIIA
jgi:uncharacterized protein YndB with AHSA1/START domain